MNLANKITISRVLMVPLFLFFLLTDSIPSPYNEVIACIIFIIAASTDGLDGYIARKRKQVTNFGKFMDPLADKLLVTAALISLVGMNKLDSWMAIVIIAREFIVTGLRLVAASEGLVIAASIWGKIKTVSQIIAIVAILLDNLLTVKLGLFFVISGIVIKFNILLMWVAVIFTIYSMIDYINKNKDVINVHN